MWRRELPRGTCPGPDVVAGAGGGGPGRPAPVECGGTGVPAAGVAGRSAARGPAVPGGGAGAGSRAALPGQGPPRRRSHFEGVAARREVWPRSPAPGEPPGGVGRRARRLLPRGDAAAAGTGVPALRCSAARKPAAGGEGERRLRWLGRPPLPPAAARPPEAGVLPPGEPGLAASRRTRCPLSATGKAGTSLREELGREMQLHLAASFFLGWLKYPRSPFFSVPSVALAPGGFGFRGSSWIWLDLGCAGAKLWLQYLLLCKKSDLLKKCSRVFRNCGVLGSLEGCLASLWLRGGCWPGPALLSACVFTLYLSKLRVRECWWHLAGEEAAKQVGLWAQCGETTKQINESCSLQQPDWSLETCLAWAFI